MVERTYKKGLVVGIVVLFICVGVQPTNADDISIRKETTEENNDSGDWGFGFIYCSAVYIPAGAHSMFPMWWEVVECIDLETGKVVRQKRTNIFGRCLIKFLPMGRDYELYMFHEEYGYDSVIVRDLGFFQKVHLIITWC